MDPGAAGLRDEFERELVERSLALTERLALLRDRPGWLAADDQARPWLERWARHLGGAEALEKRLAWEGLTAARVLPALGRVRLPPGHPAPAWLLMLRHVMTEGPSAAAPWAEVPFAACWAPFVVAARRHAAASAGLAWRRFEPPAVAQLERALARDLARCGWRCLLDEFDMRRWPALGSEGHFALALGQPLGTRLYDAFVAGLRGPGLRDLLARRPALARLLGTRLAFWVAATSELALRLERDTPEIERTFGLGAGPVTDVETGLSDPHGGGRVVLALTFASGGRLVYKPRDLSAEGAFQDLLRELHDGAPAPLALDVLARPGYGWEQHLAAREPHGRDESTRHLEASGVLLAALHLVRAVDCHHENVLAVGDRPALVDAETLLAPTALAAAGQASLAARVEESVLRTAFLPGWRPARDGGAEDVSALGYAGTGPAPLRWRDLHTDGMRLERGPAVRPPACAAGLPSDAQVAAVQRGFRRAHARLRELRDSGRLAGALRPFGSALLRVVLRGTPVYQELLQDSLSSEALGHGLARSLRLERLARALLADEPRAAPAALLRAEQEALLDGDVPRFVVRAGETRLATLDAADGRWTPLDGTGHLPEPGTQVLERALDRLDEGDLELQLRLIEGCYAAGTASRAEPGPGTPLAPEPGDDPAWLCEEGLALARGLARGALPDAGGGSAWLGLEFDPQWRVFRAGLLGPTLYGGSAGIALFLAGAFAVSREEPLRQAARAALVPLLEAVEHDPAALAGQLPLGGFSGVGGLLFVLAHARGLLELPELAELGTALAAALRPEAIERDQGLDVVAGAAGLILGGAALHALAPSSVTLGLVGLAASHLERQARTLEGGVGWGPPDRPALCGFAHGNSGIALALGEAARLVPGRGWSELAVAATAWERQHRLDQQANWRDLRSEGPDSLSFAAWCHGAPGIALARARLLSLHERPEWRDDLRVALEGTRRSRLEAGHLCCGQAGLDEVLLELGRRTHDESLAAEARARGLARVRAARREGWRVRPGIPPHVSVPGMMQGLSGIGYGLLRLGSPAGLLPPLLSLAPPPARG